MTGVARLHCLYLAGVSVVRCQIVFTVVVYLLSVSVFQALKLFSPGRVSVYLCPSWRPCTAEDICTSTVFGVCTSTVFGVCTCTASSSHLHCVLELSNKDYLFFTRNWISSFLYRDRSTPKRKENLKWHLLNRHVTLLFHTGHTKSRKLFTQTFSPFAKNGQKNITTPGSLLVCRAAKCYINITNNNDYY